MVPFVYHPTLYRNSKLLRLKALFYKSVPFQLFLKNLIAPRLAISIEVAKRSVLTTPLPLVNAASETGRQERVSRRHRRGPGRASGRLNKMS